MKFHNCHGHTHPPEKMLPVGEARLSQPVEIIVEPFSRHGRIVRQPRRLASVIRELKKRHRKKSRAFHKSLCRNHD